MSKYLDPKNDLTFKKVFGEHKHLCISLLNSLLKFKGNEQIDWLEYETGELIPEIPALKDSIVDVRCKDKKGREFIVEMQLLWSNSFKSRILLNATKAFVKQLDAGKDYRLLEPVYSLNLVNEIFEPEMKDFYHHYKIVNIEHTEKQIKGLEFVFVELPKYKPDNENAESYFDLWLRFFTEINEKTEEIPAVLSQNADLDEAVQLVRESAYTKEQLWTYDKYHDSIMTQRTFVVDAFEEGKMEGKEEGRAEGEAKGRAKGKAEGKAEVALNLKNLGIPAAQISRATGLSIQEIEAL